MNNPSNNQLTALAMMLVTLLAVCTMLCLTTSASAQVGRPYSGPDDFKNIKNVRLFTIDSPDGTWMRADDLRDKRINRGIASVVAIAVYPPSAIILAPLTLADAIVTKRKIRKNANLISK